MQKMILVFAVLSLSIVSCSKKKVFQLDTPISLAMGESASCSNCPEKMSISFTNIMEDSRCPIGTNCIWEGKAVVRLAVNMGKTQTIELMVKGNAKQGNTKSYRGYDFTFQSLTPYPKYGEEVKIEDIRFSVLVQKQRNRGKV
jgi:hypothetical protein